VNLTSISGSDVVRAYVEGPQINPAATDVGVGFTTFPRRNQAQTHQVEVELTGAGPHLLTLGFDLGTNLTNPDSDNDGLPDAWEMTYLGTLNGTAASDSDLDGLSNMQEYVLGSNPNLASSGRPATSVASGPGGFVFTFPTILGRTYQPQVSTDLSNWSALGSPMVGDGTSQSVTDPVAGSKRFYRVHVSIP